MFYVSFTTTPNNYHVVFNGNKEGLTYCTGKDDPEYSSVFIGNRTALVEACEAANIFWSNRLHSNSF